jgi:hypothetical protein
VIDSGIKRALIRTCKVSPPDIDVVGHPHLEKVSADISLKRLQRRQHSSKRTLAFFSTPINDSEAGPGLQVMSALIPHLARHAPLKLLVKPHPREQYAPWRDWLDQFRAQPVSGDIDISLAIDVSASDILCTVDAIIGLPTSVTLEATFSGIPVVVIEPSWWPVRNVAIRNYLADNIATDESIPEKLSSLIERIGSPATTHRDGSIKDAARRTAKAIRRLAQTANRRAVTVTRPCGV